MIISINGEVVLMSSLFSLIFLVSLIYFIVLWRKKKGAKNTNNQELYQAISKKKRIVGIVCIATFVLAGVTAPSTTKTATTTNTPQTKTENKKVETQKTLQQKALEDKSVPVEYRNALKKGITYANTMHMSKPKVYHQLTSEYGEKFAPEAAKWAVEHMSDIDWKAQALKKAQSYQKDMSMSKERIRKQLTSEYGEGFTQEEADYAISKLAN